MIATVPLVYCDLNEREVGLKNPFSFAAYE